MKNILKELSENEEIVMFLFPEEQMDADEPRKRIEINGPSRLMDRLFNSIFYGEEK